MTQSRELSAEERAGLAELLEKATPGEWTTDRDLPYARKPYIFAQDFCVAVVGNSQNERQDQWEDDAALIVALKKHAPALLASASRLAAVEAERDRLKEALTFYRDAWHAKPSKHFGLGLEYKPTEELLDDCGNKAMVALSTTAKGGEA